MTRRAAPMEFFIFLFGLVVITLIGHGIWGLFATAIRAGIGSEPTAIDEPRALTRRCTRCGRLLLPGRDRCAVCGRERESAIGEELLDLEATARQLTAFVKAGTIDAE